MFSVVEAARCLSLVGTLKNQLADVGMGVASLEDVEEGEVVGVSGSDPVKGLKAAVEPVVMVVDELEELISTMGLEGSVPTKGGGPVVGLDEEKEALQVRVMVLEEENERLRRKFVQVEEDLATQTHDLLAEVRRAQDLGLSAEWGEDGGEGDDGYGVLELSLQSVGESAEGLLEFLSTSFDA